MAGTDADHPAGGKPGRRIVEAEIPGARGPSLRARVRVPQLHVESLVESKPKAPVRARIGDGFLLFRKAVAKVRADRSLSGAAGHAWEIGRSRLQAYRDATAQCIRLINAGEYDRALLELGRLEEGASTDAARRRRISLLRVEALFKSGRAQDAQTALAEVERLQGPSPDTRAWAARLASFSGRFQAALDACTQAQLELAVRKGSERSCRRLGRLRAEALCTLGRPDEARRFLQAVLGNQLPENADLVALRRTVQSPESVEAFLALLLPWLTQGGQVPIVSLFHFSTACRDNGMMDAALGAARQRFLAGVERSSFGENPPLPRRGWAAAAECALLDLQGGFERLGLEFFLVSGTLLGCVRERGILRHDKDMDVGVFTEIAPAALRKAVSEWGQFKVRPLRTDRMIQIEHANGVLIDIFLHWQEGDLVFHEGQKARWWNKPFGLQETEFLGRAFKIPTNPEAYLTENYGAGWRTPDRTFETFTDTPNMVAADREHLAWYFLTKLYDYFYWGKPVQFAKVWRGLQNLVQPDPVLRAVAERIIASTLRESAP